ncbi:unnamed protein product, partial [Tetraodon nigroviridis]
MNDCRHWDVCSLSGSAARACGLHVAGGPHCRRSPPMNPSPDRSKECLPPKKRESRQGSTEHHVTLDEFKPPVPLRNCREMGSYINSGRHDNSSSLFSPSYAFSHHPIYSPDPSSLNARHRYVGKRPNGLDGPGSRTASTSRTLITGEYGNDSSRTRLEVSPLSSQSNGGRRQQDDPTSHVHSGGVLFSDYQALEGPEPHSSFQDRQIHGISKISSSLIPTRPHPLGPVPRAGRGSLLEPLGATPAEGQIYYSLGSVYQPTPHAQAYPLFSPSGTPLYNLHREQGPRLHSQRNSPNSPLGLPNNHDRLQRDRDKNKERDKVPQRDEERGADKQSGFLEHKDQHSDQNRRQERERDRERELSPSPTSPLGLHPPPPPLLPHFTKGSLIELASGRLKRVEELRTEDFLRSADTSPEFHLSTCTVLLISPSSVHGFSHLQVHMTDLNTQEFLKVLVEYPFFVQNQGWSSCCPQRTLQLYGLPCRQLTEGDVCLALTP